MTLKKEAMNDSTQKVIPLKKGRNTPPGKPVLPLERKITELTVLYEVSQLIGGTLNCQDVFSDILGTFHTRLGMNRGTITLLNPATGKLEIRAAHGMSAEEVARGRYLVGEGITGKVMETGEPAVVPQIEKEPLFLNRTRSRDRIEKRDISFICVPVKSGAFTYGTLSVDRLFNEDIAF